MVAVEMYSPGSEGAEHRPSFRLGDVLGRFLRQGAVGGAKDRDRSGGAGGSSAAAGRENAARWAGITAACAGIRLSGYSSRR